jgi:hypothetical protein
MDCAKVLARPFLEDFAAADGFRTDLGLTHDRGRQNLTHGSWDEPNQGPFQWSTRGENGLGSFMSVHEKFATAFSPVSELRALNARRGPATVWHPRPDRLSAPVEDSPPSAG